MLPHATAAWTHWELGNLQLRLLPALVLGSALGSAAASRLAHRLPESVRFGGPPPALHPSIPAALLPCHCPACALTFMSVMCTPCASGKHGFTGEP